jgi:competence protein ComEC
MPMQRFSVVCLTLLALVVGALLIGCGSTGEPVTQSSVALPASVSSSATTTAVPSTTIAASSTPTSLATTTTTQASTTTTSQASTTTVSVTTTASPSTTATIGGSPLEIVTVRYDAPGNDNTNLNEEYVVFKVLVPLSLLGYAVEDEYGHRYDFPDRTFEKGQTFTLHTGKGTDTQTDLYWGASGSAIWNNDKDTVKVLDPGGQVVTSQSYSGD